MEFDVFTEIVFVEKMETLTCFCNSRICRALSLNEILVIVPLIKKMMSSSVSQVADIDALIALFDKNDGSENDYLEKFTMAYICANNELNRMRLEKKLSKNLVKRGDGTSKAMLFDPVRTPFSSFTNHISKIQQKGGRNMIKRFKLKLNMSDCRNIRASPKDKTFLIMSKDEKDIKNIIFQNHAVLLL